MNNIEISIVVPIYNEEGNIEELYAQLTKEIKQTKYLNYEIIFIDDGSIDQSWKIIKNLNKKDNTIKGIMFSRNFGHQYALKAGLDISQGNAVISMDADLQHPPKMIHDFLKTWEEGFDIVQAIRKKTRGANFFKSLNSKLFYRILNSISDVDFESGASDFRLLDRKVVNEIKKMKENQLFIRGIISWIGFNKKNIEYIAPERFSGYTKYTMKKMLKFAIDGIMSFSVKPLRLATYFGFSISIFSFLYALIVLYLKFFTNIQVLGLSSILFSILFIGGLNLLILGIIGEYIGKIFIQIKQRDVYLISEKIGR